MDDKKRTRLSRRLSKILRHDAVKHGLALRADGYARLSSLLALPCFQGTTAQDVEAVVAACPKQRFGILRDRPTRQSHSDGVWIRCHQGHSIAAVDAALERLHRPADAGAAVHGTTLAAWQHIKTDGLRRMSRNHVHMALGEPGVDGVISGMRRSSDVLIYVDVAAAEARGIPFFLSTNGVVLTPGPIPPACFRRVVQRPKVGGAVVTLFENSAAPATTSVLTSPMSAQASTTTSAPATTTASPLAATEATTKIGTPSRKRGRSDSFAHADNGASNATQSDGPSDFDAAMLRTLVDARSLVARRQRAVNGCIVAVAARPPSRDVIAWGYVRSMLHENRPEGKTKNWRPPTDVHAEADLVASAARSGRALEGCSVFVSSIPCEACFRLMVAAGVARIVHPPPPRPDFYAKTAKHCKRLAERHNVVVDADAALPKHRGCAADETALGMPVKKARGE
jgi:2'-phosphotransferase